MVLKYLIITCIIVYITRKTQYGDKIVIGNIVNTPENPLQSKKQSSKLCKIRGRNSKRLQAY